VIADDLVADRYGRRATHLAEADPRAHVVRGDTSQVAADSNRRLYRSPHRADGAGEADQPGSIDGVLEQ